MAVADQNTTGIRYSISEAARLLDRSPHTLRTWSRNHSMPAYLEPQRDERGHRYWTPELIEAIKQWMRENNFVPGRELHYRPNPAQLQKHLNKIRRQDDPQLANLRALIHDAVYVKGVDPSMLTAHLPRALDVLNKNNPEPISLDQALRVASEVLAKHGG